MAITKVGLCAFGMSGSVFHAPIIEAHPSFSLHAVVQRNGNIAQEKYPEITTYRSVEDLLQLSDCDLIVVNTPVQLHFQHAEKALKAGKNIIVEKPFTTNCAEALQLVTLAKEVGQWISVYQNRRFDRDYLLVKKIISENKLGQLKEAEIRFDRFRREGSGKAHKENPNFPASGTLHDLGAHLIDQALQLFGKPNAVFADIFSMKGDQFANDYFEILLYYPDNFRCRLKSSVFVKEDYFAYKIFGKEGTFLQERSDLQEVYLGQNIIPNLEENWQKPLEKPDGILNVVVDDKTTRTETYSKPGNYMHYYQQISDFYNNKATLPSAGNEIVSVMKIIDAASKSSQSQKVISLQF